MKTTAPLFSAFERPIVVQPTGPLHLLLKLIGWRCWCTTRSRVFRDDDGYYTRCLQCGNRVAYFGPVV